MTASAKKVTAYILSALIVIVTTIALLGVWEIIELEHVMQKILTSLLIIFAASVVTLFVYQVVLKEPQS